MSITKKISDRIKYGCDLETFDYLEHGSFQPSASDNPRINLLIGTIDPSKMYGGLTTAFLFFNSIVERLGIDSRILVMEDPVTADMMMNYPEYRLLRANEADEPHHSVINYSLKNNSGRERLLIRKRDVFVATFWTTMYIGESFRSFQKDAYGIGQKLVYFIQDYEPGFYPWSSEYLLADSTYRIEDTIAVFNSKNLYAFFKQQGYVFSRSAYFEPKLNPRLKTRLLEEYLARKDSARKKQVIIYGRPNRGRNCFSLIVAALKQALAVEPELRSWTFLSLGAPHKDIDLGFGVKLTCLGKLSLDEYANVLFDSKVGISLMCSPHPSYPPLEMSTFGVQTITNAYLCKDLSSFNHNIISLDRISITQLQKAIETTIKMADGIISLDTLYLDNHNQFDMVNDMIASELSMLGKGFEA